MAVYRTDLSPSCARSFLSYPGGMPNNHVVLVAERRKTNPRKRKREIVYATMDEAMAKQDAKALGARHKKMRYYVMPYNDALDVAEGDLRQLEKVLDDAKKMRSL